MAVDPIVVTFDHAQQRIGRDRLAVLAEGSTKGTRGARQTGWDLATSIDVYQDPVTFTSMLLPGPADKANWDVSTTGIYTKYTLADLTFSDATGWVDTPVPGSLGWIKKANCDEDVVYSPTLSNINQAMYMAAFGFGGADTKRVLFDCGWSDGPATDWVGFRIYANGDVDVYEGTVLVATGKIESAINESWVGLMFIPMRRRELLVQPVEGKGFSHVFEHLPEDGTVQTIVPASKFWVKIWSGTATIQIAKIQYKTTGTLYSERKFFADPPPSSPPALETLGYYDSAGYGAPSATVSLVEDDLSGAFAPNGVKDECRVKVALSGGPSSTPFVYAALAAYGAEAVDTNDTEEAELVWEELSLTVPDSPDGAKVSVQVRDPENAGIDRLTLVGNRPVHVHTGGVTVLDGRGSAPKVSRGRVEALDTMVLDVSDSWGALKNYRFQERVPLDGVDWKDAVEFVLLATGIKATQLDVEDPGLTLGGAGSPTAGEWSVLIKEGDTAASWVERLFEGFAGDWFYGFVPQATGLPKFVGKSPASMGSTPDVELFTTRAAAVSHLTGVEGWTSAEASRYAWQRLVQSFSETRVMPEATDIRVTGLDLRKNKLIQSKYVDSGAEDPTVAPSLRQDNWMGERVRFGYSEPMLTTQDLTDDAAARLGDRITRVRTLADFDSDWIILPTGAPVWRGHLVRIDSDKKYRVRSLRMRSVKDVDDSGGTGLELACRRPASYTVELVDGSPPWAVSTGQVGAKAVTEAQLRRMAQQNKAVFDELFGLSRGQ